MLSIVNARVGFIEAVLAYISLGKGSLLLQIKRVGDKMKSKVFRCAKLFWWIDGYLLSDFKHFTNVSVTQNWSANFLGKHISAQQFFADYLVELVFHIFIIHHSVFALNVTSVTQYNFYFLT